MGGVGWGSRLLGRADRSACPGGGGLGQSAERLRHAWVGSNRTLELEECALSDNAGAGSLARAGVS